MTPPTKNPAAVALGRMTSARKAEAARRNGRLFAGLPPSGVPLELWRQAIACARAHNIEIPTLRAWLTGDTPAGRRRRLARFVKTGAREAAR